MILVWIATLGFGVAAFGQQPVKGESPKPSLHGGRSPVTENAPGKMTAFYDQSKELEMIVSAGISIQGSAEVPKVFRDAKSEVCF